MNPLDRDALSMPLAQAVDAARVVPEPQTAAAQQRLLARLAPARSVVREGGGGEPRARSAASRWLALGAAAALASVVLLALPLLRDDGLAFAAVQRHFLAFRTLEMRIEQRAAGALLGETRVWTDAQGRVRTDANPGLSVRVDPPARRIAILLHDQRQAMLMPLPGPLPAAAPGAGLEWLEEIRRFQGKARPLDETRQIDGRNARGWSLPVGAGALVLWADEHDVPIAMELDAAGSMELRYRFVFDGETPPGGLTSDVPEGYRLVEPDAE